MTKLTGDVQSETHRGAQELYAESALGWRMAARGSAPGAAPDADIFPAYGQAVARAGPPALKQGKVLPLETAT